jgi:threonyl-tRNA synthetase
MSRSPVIFEESSSFQNSASYFLGDPNNDSLQRVYGISFPDKKQLTDYKVILSRGSEARPPKNCQGVSLAR